MAQVFLDNDNAGAGAGAGADADMITLIKGDVTLDPKHPGLPNYTTPVNYRICVNLSRGNMGTPYAGLYVVEVYDADLGGPCDTWVSEYYTTRPEAEAAFTARVEEVEANIPNYVDNVWCADEGVTE